MTSEGHLGVKHELLRFDVCFILAQGKQVAEALLVREGEALMQHGGTEIAIDKQHTLAALGVDDGEIDAQHALAFAGGRSW